MKEKIIFLTMLITLNVTSQIKSGTVSYGVTVIENKDSKLDELMLSMNANYLTITKEFEFTLTFNSKESFFLKTEKLYSDEDASKMGILKIGFHGNILQKNDSLYKETSLERIGNFIVKKEILKGWVISAETKFIDQYKCYKATNEIVVINPKGTFKHPVTAWFCPQIPFAFGPNGFGALPGLILELQTKDAVFGTKKIILSNDTIVLKTKLKNYKAITDQEIEKLIEKKHEEFMNEKE
ncbi:GLPGLI family protein [Flavobacterium sp.]|uniref:GLPGLI family protein n=1 Tax=Flavobacterium sp. TaxID=239 RepID=UPI002487E348|nr:GLPGLI family protein [Flavobacterium sp.]MDI1316716.1 GLPGLI family protein [Flavobacterium sp.]